MSGTWRGLMCAGVLVAMWPPAVSAGALTEAVGPEAPLLTTADGPHAVQGPPPPTPPPAAPAPVPAPTPVPPRAVRQQERMRERQVWREGERNWVDGEVIVRQFKGGEGITLDLVNMLGDVVVVGGKGREGRLAIMRKVQGRATDVEELLKAIEVDVSEHANRIEVRAAMPMPPQQPQRVQKVRMRTDYEITLPSGTALELKNMQGNVRLTNLGGDVRVEAMAGDVVGEALSRVRMLRSMSGDVMLSRSVVQGDANLQSVSGNVIASGVKAASLTLGSVSGNVQVKESSSERALVRTVTGDIEFASVSRKAGRYELKSHAGDIFVFTGPGGFEFEANTVKGEVSSDVPTRPGTAGTHQVRGSVGDGAAYFDLTTFTGDIRVVRKP
jgi:DUF4097 and DUF4098 domain-containing protein YvlB